MSLYEIYKLVIDDSDNDVKIGVDDILKLLEKYLNKNKFISDEEVDLVENILERLEDFKDDSDNKIIKRINKIIFQFTELVNEKYKSMENEDTSIDSSSDGKTETTNENSTITIENFVVKHPPRTDTNLIKPETIKIVNDSLLLFKDVVKEEKDNVEILNNYFKNPKTALINMSIKNKLNLYSLDRYGLVIRRNAYMKKNSLYGWKFDENKEPIHYLVKPDTCSDEENIKAVLNAQYLMNQKAFSSVGIIYKIYSKYYPERLLMFNIH